MTSSTSLSSSAARLSADCPLFFLPGALPTSAGEPVLCLSADDLPPLASFDSVTWPSLSTIVVPSENATDLRGLRSASYCSGQTHMYMNRLGASAKQSSAAMGMDVECTMHFDRGCGARGDVQCQP